MRGKLIGAVIIGVAGVLMLVSLGNWQVRRLHWKEALISRIETQIGLDPVPLPEAPGASDNYRAVAVEGTFEGSVLRVQSALDGQGAGYRLIQAMKTGDRRVMVERGFLPQDNEEPEAPAGKVRVEGNLLWPQEVDRFTPPPDLAALFFYARDVPAMAEVLGTDPVLVVRRGGAGGGGLITVPVGVAGIRNDHREYAITWFSLAAVWLVMSVVLIYRMRRQVKDGETEGE